MDDDNEVISPHQVFIRMNHLDDIKENVFYIPLHDDIYQLNIVCIFHLLIINSYRIWKKHIKILLKEIIM